MHAARGERKGARSLETGRLLCAGEQMGHPSCCLRTGTRGEEAAFDPVTSTPPSNVMRRWGKSPTGTGAAFSFLDVIVSLTGASRRLFRLFPEGGGA